MAIDDLRRKDPTRASIDRSTVVFDDLTDQLLVISLALSRLEIASMSRSATDVRRETKRLIEVAELFVRRMADEQLAMNKDYAAGTEERRKAWPQWKRDRFEARKARSS